jgi:uncharacterized protein YbjT (DUF2867 family)
MRVAVVGASGKTGSLIVCALLNAGHDVVAFARSPDSAEAVVTKSFSDKLIADASDDKALLRRVTYAQCDVSESPPTRADLAGCVAAVWAAQSTDRRILLPAPGPQGPKSVEQVALANFAATCAAVDGLQRIVVVSSQSADRWGALINLLLNFLTGQAVLYKHAGEKAVAEVCAGDSGLRYVVVRPGGLRDASALGPSRVVLAPRLSGGGIARADVAGIAAAASVFGGRLGKQGRRGMTFDCAALNETEADIEAATWIDALEAVKPLEEAEQGYMK